MTLQHKWPGAVLAVHARNMEYVVCRSSLSWSGPHTLTCSTIYSMTQYFHIVKQIPGAKWWMMIDIRYQRLWLDAGTSTLTHQKWLYLAGWAAAPML